MSDFMSRLMAQEAIYQYYHARRYNQKTAMQHVVWIRLQHLFHDLQDSLDDDHEITVIDGWRQFMHVLHRTPAQCAFEHESSKTFVYAGEQDLVLHVYCMPSAYHVAARCEILHHVHDAYLDVCDANTIMQWSQALGQQP